MNKEKIKIAMGELVGVLHQECCYSGLISKEQWNESIAPKLKNLGLIIDGYDENTPTARTYKFPQL